MLEVNPFDSQEFKKSLLGESFVESSEDVEYEELNEEGSLDDFKNIISSAPTIPSSGAVKTVIKDAGALLKDSQEAKATQMNQALSEVMTKYNEDFGLDLKIDFSSFSRTLIACADTKRQQCLALYLSKIFRSLRPLVILNCISKLTLALDQILAPENLLNPNELSLTDRFLAVSTIMDYIGKLEEMKDSILIDNEDLNLKKIAQENNMDYSEQDEEMVADFIRLFKKENGLEE